MACSEHHRVMTQMNRLMFVEINSTFKAVCDVVICNFATFNRTM